MPSQKPRTTLGEFLISKISWEGTNEKTYYGSNSLNNYVFCSIC